MADVDFFFDPVCPWAWITSRWVEEVAGERGLAVDWRFICLRLVNKDKDYGTDFPEGYVAGHGTGQKLLRVAAAIREAEGGGSVGAFTRVGTDIHVNARGGDIMDRWEEGFPEYLAEIGVAGEQAGAANDERWDKVLEAETAEALSRVGDDVGTPIVTFGDDPRASFFGPVISRIPRGPEAVALWDAVELIARTPGMIELKRSLREAPQTS